MKKLNQTKRDMLTLNDMEYHKMNLGPGMMFQMFLLFQPRLGHLLDLLSKK